MIDIGIGLSLEKNPSLAAKEAVKLAKENIRIEKFDLALLFSSTDISCLTLLKTIAASLGSVPIIGCSAAAVISNQGIFKHGLVLMLLKFPEGIYCNTAYTREIKTKSGIVAGEELGAKLLSDLQNIPRTLGLFFTDGLIKEETGLIFGLQERLGKSFPIIGASASDNLNLSRTYLYFNQELFNHACAGVICGGRLNFGLGIKHGFKPLGKPHTVTAAKNNVVKTIDGKPAAQLYEEYLGFDMARLKKELKHISLLYPLGIYLSGEKEYLLRNILFIEDNGVLYFKGSVPEGSTVRLMISTKEGCLDAVRQAVEQAKQGLAAQIFGPIREIKKETTRLFAIVFSSISRFLFLKKQINREIEIIKEGLGRNIPIIGLATSSELAPLKAASYRGQVYFHNQAVSVLIIEG